ncbi:hypothetical protein PSPO01_03783 [Paraphaeosphaeria sporulosa]
MSIESNGYMFSSGVGERISKNTHARGTMNFDLQVGRRAAVEVASDAEIERQWWAHEAEKRTEAERPTQGTRLYDIVDLVKEIKYDGVEEITEAQKQEMVEIQLAKLDRKFYIDPGRLAMINGGSYRPGRDGPLSVPYASEIDVQAFLVAAMEAGRQKAERAREDAARKQAIRDCAACFKQRRRNDRRPCEQHHNRNMHDNVMTSVALCPHTDMRLFWFADDPANKKDTWLLDVSEVHSQDLDAHAACKIMPVENALEELVGLLKKSMEHKNLRAPNLSRVAWQLPAVWDLLNKDKKTGVVEVAHESPTDLPPPEYNPYDAGSIAPLTGQYTGVHRMVRPKIELSKTDQRKLKVRNARREKRVMGTRRKGTRVVGSDYEDDSSDEDTESDTETKLPVKKASTKKAISTETKTVEPENRYALSKSTAKPKKHVEAPTPTEKATKQATKAKTTTKNAAPKTPAAEKQANLSEEIICDSDEGLSDDDTFTSIPKPPPKSQSTKRKVEESEVSSSHEDIQEPAAKTRRATPTNEVVQQPTPETEVASPESSEPETPSSVKFEVQPSSPKKRKASKSFASAAAMKRKTSIVEEESESEVLTVEIAEFQQPTPSTTSSDTLAAGTRSRSSTPSLITDSDEDVVKSSGCRGFSQWVKVEDEVDYGSSGEE